MADAHTDSPITSSFAHDEEMADLVALFVDELPDRIAAFADAAEKQSWETVRTISHQLKGAAPGYGFDSVGEAAGRVERLVCDGSDADQLTGAVRTLIALCNRVSKA